MQKIIEFRKRRHERDRSIEEIKQKNQVKRVQEVEVKIRKRINQIRKQRLKFEEQRELSNFNKQIETDLSRQLSHIIDKKRENDELEAELDKKRKLIEEYKKLNNDAYL